MNTGNTSKPTLQPSGMVLETSAYHMWVQDRVVVVKDKKHLLWTPSILSTFHAQLGTFYPEKNGTVLFLVESDKDMSRLNSLSLFNGIGPEWCKACGVVISDTQNDNGITQIKLNQVPFEIRIYTTQQLYEAWVWLKTLAAPSEIEDESFNSNLVCLRTRSANLCVYENSHVEAQLLPVEQQLEDASENISILKRLASDRKMPFLLDIREARHITIDARKHYSAAQSIQFASQIAIIAESLLTRTMSNTLLRLFAKNTSVDIRIFNDPNEAKSWFNNWTTGTVNVSNPQLKTLVPLGESEVNELLETLSRYTALEFDGYIPIRGKNAFYDALGLTINMLGEELKNSIFTKDYFQQIMNNAPAILYSCSAIEPFEIQFVSDKICEFGFKREDIIKNANFWHKHIHQDELESFYSTLANDNNQQVNQHYFRFIDGFGDQRWFKHNFKYIKDAKNTTLGIAGFLQDVTPEIRQQEELKEQREFLNTILNSINEGVCGIDFEGNVIFMNPAGCKMLGYKEEELIGSHLLHMGFHVSEDGVTRTFKDTILFSTIKDGHVRSEPSVRISRNANHETYVDYTVSPLVKEGVRIGAVVTFSNGTEKRKAAEMLESQKASLINAAQLSALGEMAGGIAHEVNNPLAGIQGKVFQLIRSVKANNFTPEKILSDLQKVYDTSERIAKIIRGLRAFSRNAENDPFEVVNAKFIIEQSLEFTIERLKNHGINVTFGQTDDCRIECRPTQLIQVLIGMINNSYDVINGLNEKWIRFDIIRREDGKSLLTITDSGAGIKPEIAKKIMQPFFSTKGVGKGVGLGLSIAVGIITQHGGRLYLDPDCPNTRFVIEIPLSVEEEEQSA